MVYAASQAFRQLHCVVNLKMRQSLLTCFCQNKFGCQVVNRYCIYSITVLLVFAFEQTTTLRAAKKVILIFQFYDAEFFFSIILPRQHIGIVAFVYLAENWKISRESEIYHKIWNQEMFLDVCMQTLITDRAQLVNGGICLGLISCNSTCPYFL
jgi:hypothetical protein